MVLDTSLLNTQHYKLRIKGSGAIQGKELRPPLHLGVVVIEKGAFESTSPIVANFTYYYMYTIYIYIYIYTLYYIYHRYIYIYNRNI